jgi:hypothetical protein
MTKDPNQLATPGPAGGRVAVDAGPGHGQCSQGGFDTPAVAVGRRPATRKRNMRAPPFVERQKEQLSTYLPRTIIATWLC